MAKEFQRNHQGKEAGISNMENLVQKYGKYFWTLPLLFSIRELYQVLYTTKGDMLDFLMMVGMTYWFWGMSVGKFSYKE